MCRWAAQAGLALAPLRAGQRRRAVREGMLAPHGKPGAAASLPMENGISPMFRCSPARDSWDRRTSFGEADQGGNCPNTFLGFGGTSVSSPAFAGIMALVNQQYGRQGNANYVFYKLAAKAGASCKSAPGEASTCIFNDVTVGTNAGPCAAGSPNCLPTTGVDAYGVMSGYNAGAGYDLATGLGSVNANNLVTKWNSVSTLPSATTLSGVTPTPITHGQAVTFTASVKPQTGTGTPTGTISLLGPTTTNNTSQGIAGFNLTNGTVTGTTELLPGGTYSL